MMAPNGERHTHRAEWLFYVAVGAGMALSNSAFAMVAALFTVTPMVPALVALLLAAAICAVIGAAIGELASMWPSSPAVLTYFRAAFGHTAALVLVHFYLLFVVMIAGVESYGFAMVVQAGLPGVPPGATIVAVVSVVVLANLRGLDLPRRLQILTAFGTMAILTASAIGALTVLPLVSAPVATAPAGWSGLPAAVGLAIFIYTGFEWVTPVGLSRQAYARRVPLSMLIAIAVLLVTYALFVAALGATLPTPMIAASMTPQVPLLTALIGGPGVALALIVAAGAIFSTFNAGIMGGAQLLQALAREQALPRWVAYRNPVTGAPIGAVILLGTLGLIAALGIAAFELYLVAGLLGSAIICMVYACYVGAVERLRHILPDRARPFCNRLPLALRWAVLAVLPVIAAASLLTVPEVLPQLVVGAGVSVMLVFALTFYSMRLQRRRSPSQPVGSLR